jgi:RNA polymerase sigma factor FliA
VLLATNHFSVNAETSLPLSEVLDVVDRAAAALARKLPSFISREDLVSVGKLAVAGMLPKCTGSLSDIRARCYVRARGAMLDEIRNADTRPRRLRDLMRAVHLATSAFEVRNGRVPSDTELAALVGVNVSLVRRAVAASAADEAHQSFSWETVADENAIAPSESAEQGDLRKELLAMLNALTPSQARAVRLFYMEDLTLEQIGSSLGVSTERARQLRDRGVEKLRDKFAALETWRSLIAMKD